MPPLYQAAFEVPPIQIEVENLRCLCRGQETFRYKSLTHFHLHCNGRRLRLTLLFDTGDATFHAFEDWMNRLAQYFTPLAYPAHGRWPGYVEYDDDFYVRRGQRTVSNRAAAMADHVDHLLAQMQACAAREGRVLELYTPPSEALEAGAREISGPRKGSP